MPVPVVLFSRAAPQYAQETTLKAAAMVMIKRLDGRLFIDAEHRCMLRGMQIKPSGYLRGLRLKLRSFEAT